MASALSQCVFRILRNRSSFIIALDRNSLTLLGSLTIYQHSVIEPI